jgi:YfiH family protein
MIPDWPAPPWVRCRSTTRLGGTSLGPYASLNLGDHVGDDPQRVAENRARLAAALALPAEPLWLAQVHGCTVAECGTAPPGCRADAAVARGPGLVCAVLTADCLPVLLCERGGGAVAAVHAGWRGLAAGVLEAAVESLGGPPGEVLAWLGPAIGPAAFEVGAEVRETFADADAGASAAFSPGRGGRWQADLFALARQRLGRAGVRAVYGGGLCTHADPSRVFL